MKRFPTKTLVLLAMFASLQVLFSKFLMVQASPSVRFSIDSVPILLAGLLFGPFAGALVGVIGDMLGTILFPTAGVWYPPLTLCCGAVGLVAGWFQKSAQASVKARILAVLAADAIGSLLLKTLALTGLTGLPFPVQLAARAMPVGVNFIMDASLVTLLYRPLSNLLHRESPKAAHEMTYEEALAFIHSVDWRGSVFGFARIDGLLDRLGHPERGLRYVHVAGTNGKGSTCAMLASIFEKAGYRTGLYVSPYITRFNERIQVNGEQIPDGDLARLTAKVKTLAADMADKPTEFELVTAIGLAYFQERGCDIVITEVGMGGRLDATNVIPCPELAVITNIGLDHTKILGDTLAKIAFEKAGIFKEGCDAVYYGHEPEADAVIRRVADEKHCTLSEAEFDRVTNTRLSGEALTFDYAPLSDLTLHLVGAYQLKNVAVVLKCVERLRLRGWKLTDEAVRLGLAAVRWPGRFEILSREPLFIVDGGHNPQGVRAAIESLVSLYPDRPATILMGIMADKDVAEVLSIVKPVARRFVCVTPDNPRALDAKELSARLVSLGAEAEPAPTVAEGVRRAMALTDPDGLTLALGSLYMSEDIRDCFPNRENP